MTAGPPPRPRRARPGRLGGQAATRPTTRRRLLLAGLQLIVLLISAAVIYAPGPQGEPGSGGQQGRSRLLAAGGGGDRPQPRHHPAPRPAVADPAPAPRPPCPLRPDELGGPGRPDPQLADPGGERRPLAALPLAQPRPGAGQRGGRDRRLRAPGHHRPARHRRRGARRRHLPARAGDGRAGGGRPGPPRLPLVGQRDHAALLHDRRARRSATGWSAGSCGRWCNSRSSGCRRGWAPSSPSTASSSSRSAGSRSCSSSGGSGPASRWAWRSPPTASPR